MSAINNRVMDENRENMSVGTHSEKHQISDDLSWDILRVEKVFQKRIEFDSKNELVKILGDIKSQILDTILDKLVAENKIMVNNDGSLTWIYAKGNKKLMKIWDKAISV